MDPLDQKLDYKMSGLATATKKRHLDYTGLMVDDRQGGLVAQRLVRYQTLSTAVQKKIEWCGWPGMKTPLRPCRVLDHQD